MTIEQPRRLTPEQAVAEANTESFPELVRLAGLDPARDLRFQDWSGVDFSGADLRGFDFTGARLHGCNFKSAMITNARFDQAELGGVEHTTSQWQRRCQHAPAVISDLANLRAASDWEAFKKSWQRPDDAEPDDAHLSEGAIFQDAPFAPEIVVVPAGTFIIGSAHYEDGRSDTEGPQREISISSPIAVGRYPVTFAEWDAAQASSSWELATGFKPRHPSHNGWGRGSYPVINVAWGDAQAYVKWLSAATGKAYQLLSEAVWEYACRAGTNTAYSFGDGPERLGEYAWFHGNASKRTHKIGEKAPNAFGIHDMHGNVWEWCEDVWHGSYADIPPDGRARNSNSYRKRCVVRGGSWESDPRVLRSAYRVGSVPSYQSSSTGFRVMRVLAS